MSTPTFSILHATYGRPEKAVSAMRMWLDRAVHPKNVEYIFACNSDDPTVPQLMDKIEQSLGFSSRVIANDFKGSAPAWDAAAKASTGEILIQAQDDVEPPQGWDLKLLTAIHYGTKPPDQFGCPVWWDAKGAKVFVAVSDGYRKDNLCCTAIMTRARYEQCGEFLHSGFQSVFSDDDVTIRAYADAADGKCTLVEARDLVFLHRHHYHDKTVPLDATYQRENSDEAYRIGAKLFAERNSELVRRGFRTWS